MRSFLQVVPLTVLLGAVVGCATETGPGESDVDGKADTYGESQSCTEAGGVCIPQEEYTTCAQDYDLGWVESDLQCGGIVDQLCCVPMEEPSTSCTEAGGVCIPQEEYTTCAQDYDLGWVESDLQCGGIVDQLCCVPRA
jgi:hypothetical protein